MFYYLLPFSRQLHNSVFPKLFIFLRKELFQVPFTVFQGIEIISINRIFKDKNEWKSEGAVSQLKQIIISQPSCSSLTWSSKRHSVFHHPDERLCLFCWLILDAFCQVLLSVLELIIWFSWRSSYRGLPSKSHTQHNLLWMKADLWCGWW